MKTKLITFLLAFIALTTSLVAGDLSATPLFWAGRWELTSQKPYIRPPQVFEISESGTVTIIAGNNIGNKGQVISATTSSVIFKITGSTVEMKKTLYRWWNVQDVPLTKKPDWAGKVKLLKE
jgi:hypothetical protein